MKCNFVHTVILLSAVTWAATANAVVAVPPTLEVNGRAVASSGVSNQSDQETLPPGVRTAISVSDEELGLFKYSAAADITVPKLQVFGSYNNLGATPLGNGEVALLVANAKLRDTISLIAPSDSPYVVTAELVVDGTLDVDGSDGTVTAEIKLDPIVPNEPSKSSFKKYTVNGTILNDTISVSFGFTGDVQFDIESALFFFMNTIDANTAISADFSNTAIVNLLITSETGDPLSGFTITSSSGNFGINPVPVPAALPLMLLALGGLGWRRRRRAG